MTEAKILTERRGHVLLIGLNRPAKRNAADYELLTRLALAYGELDRDPELRVGVVHAVGEHFTAGLDLADVVPHVGANGLDIVPPGGIDPWGMTGEPVSKPVVMAVQGTCLTLGIELMLASDVVIAADSATFAQVEVGRGILPFGGASIRFARAAGWGNAMRWMLTGDTFDAADALRMGLAQQVVPHGTQLERAVQVAQRIAAQAPLAVQATLANARLAARDGEQAARSALPGELVRLMQTEDAAIGLQSFLTRTAPRFVGR